ncbi:MAG: MFS transporter [Candidatus Thorarchaeota archaeon]
MFPWHCTDRAINIIPARAEAFSREPQEKRTLYAAVFIRHSSAFAIWTLWSLFLANLGGDLVMTGIVRAANSLSQVVFMVSIVDRIECRRLVLMKLIASAVTFLWFMFATDIIEILPFHMLLGISWACFYVGALKYVTEMNIERSQHQDYSRRSCQSPEYSAQSMHQSSTQPGQDTTRLFSSRWECRSSHLWSFTCHPAAHRKRWGMLMQVVLP